MKSIVEIITVVVFLGCLAMLAGMQQNNCYYTNDAYYFPAGSYLDTVPPPPPIITDTISMAIHNR